MTNKLDPIDIKINNKPEIGPVGLGYNNSEILKCFESPNSLTYT